MRSKTISELNVMEIFVGLILVTLSTFAIDRYISKLLTYVLHIDDADHWSALAMIAFYVGVFFIITDLVPGSRPTEAL